MQTDVIISPAGWPAVLQADFYRPESEPLSSAVLLIHGGGWTGGDNRHQMRGLSRKLAERGYFVMNITYRLTPEWRWPTQLEDVRMALRHLRENSGRYQVDPERIATMGYSAGAHLAAMAGLTDRGIQAMVLGGLPADLALFEKGPLVVKLIGGTKQEFPGKYAAASPVNFVTSQSPPAFIYHGTRDELVPPNQPKAFVAALAKANVPYALEWLGGRAHITTFLFSHGTTSRAIDFLDREMGR